MWSLRSELELICSLAPVQGQLGPAEPEENRLFSDRSQWVRGLSQGKFLHDCAVVYYQDSGSQ